MGQAGLNLGLNMTDRIQNKKTKNQNKNQSWLTWKNINVFLLLVIGLAGFVYLTQVNASAVNGYVIRDLEIKLEETKLNNSRLELQVQAKQSVGDVGTKVAVLGMVSADNVEYLQMPGGEVAMAK